MDPKTEREQELQAAAEPTTDKHDERDERDDRDDRDPSDDGSGEVSEAENMRSADPTTPIAPDQATAGYPDSESGGADEGEAGPNARNGSRNDRSTPFERGEATDDGREAGEGAHQRD